MSRVQAMAKLVARVRRTRLVAVTAVAVTVAMAGASMAYAGSAAHAHHHRHHKHHVRTATSSFRVATLNVLGSNHTYRPGGFASGRRRAVGEAALIHDLGIDLVGMSEVQPDQYAALARDLPHYTVWPQGALGANGYRLQIAWRRSRFTMVDSGATTYLFAGMRIPMPYALLKDRRTGATFWVVSTHNSPRGMQHQRVVSTRIENRVVNRLKAHGRPVVLLGDLNEHGAVYCRMAAATGMRSADGGWYAARCHAPEPSYIDWIMGTRRVAFSGYVRNTITRERGLSDHPIYYAKATVTARSHR